MTSLINTINFINTAVLYEKYSSTNSPNTTLMGITISKTNRSRNSASRTNTNNTSSTNTTEYITNNQYTIIYSSFNTSNTNSTIKLI